MATIGGLLLILGAWFVYRGNIYKSIITYFLADICWVVIAYSTGDIIGGTFVLIGMLLGVLVFLKMQRGDLHKTIIKEN